MSARVPPRKLLPVVVKLPTTVEEACDMEPPVRVESPVTASVPPVERLEALKVVPFHVSAVPEVMRVPSKKLMPFVTWVDVAVPPWAMEKMPEM